MLYFRKKNQTSAALRTLTIAIPKRNSRSFLIESVELTEEASSVRGKHLWSVDRWKTKKERWSPSNYFLVNRDWSSVGKIKLGNNNSVESWRKKRAAIVWLIDVRDCQCPVNRMDNSLAKGIVKVERRKISWRISPWHQNCIITTAYRHKVKRNFFSPIWFFISVRLMWNRCWQCGSLRMSSSQLSEQMT